MAARVESKGSLGATASDLLRAGQLRLLTQIGGRRHSPTVWSQCDIWSILIIWLRAYDCRVRTSLCLPDRCPLARPFASGRIGLYEILQALSWSWREVLPKSDHIVVSNAIRYGCPASLCRLLSRHLHMDLEQVEQKITQGQVLLLQHTFGVPLTWREPGAGAATWLIIVRTAYTPWAQPMMDTKSAFWPSRLLQHRGDQDDFQHNGRDGCN
jgi:hypothetical protein